MAGGQGGVFRTTFRPRPRPQPPEWRTGLSILGLLEKDHVGQGPVGCWRRESLPEQPGPSAPRAGR